jgi:putative endonuclease
LYYVYLVVSKKNNRIKSYVGYTNNLFNRIEAHNSGRGAKSTRGRYWKVAFKKKFKNKSTAMKYEFFLKKNQRLRKKIKDNYAL